MHLLKDLTFRAVDTTKELTASGIEFGKLKLMEKLVEASSSSVKVTLLICIGAISLLMFTIAGAMGLGELLGNLALGFLIMGIINLAMIFVVSFFKRWIITNIMVREIAEMFGRDDINKYRELELALHKEKLNTQYNAEKLQLFGNEAKLMMRPEVLGVELIRMIHEKYNQPEKETVTEQKIEKEVAKQEALKAL